MLYRANAHPKRQLSLTRVPPQNRPLRSTEWSRDPLTESLCSNIPSLIHAYYARIPGATEIKIVSSQHHSRDRIVLMLKGPAKSDTWLVSDTDRFVNHGASLPRRTARYKRDDVAAFLRNSPSIYLLVISRGFVSPYWQAPSLFLCSISQPEPRYPHPPICSSGPSTTLPLQASHWLPPREIKATEPSNSVSTSCDARA